MVVEAERVKLASSKTCCLCTARKKKFLSTLLANKYQGAKHAHSARALSTFSSTGLHRATLTSASLEVKEKGKKACGERWEVFARYLPPTLFRETLPICCVECATVCSLAFAPSDAENDNKITTEKRQWKCDRIHTESVATETAKNHLDWG